MEGNLTFVEIAKSTSERFDYIIDLDGDYDCKLLLYEMLGWDNIHRVHKMSGSNERKQRILDTKGLDHIRKRVQLDILLYEYLQKLIEVDCEYFHFILRGKWRGNLHS